MYRPGAGFALFNADSTGVDFPRLLKSPWWCGSAIHAIAFHTKSAPAPTRTGRTSQSMGGPSAREDAGPGPRREPPGEARGPPALDRRLPLLDERAEALLRVLAPEEARLELALEREPGLERELAARHARALDRPGGAGRAVRQGERARVRDD